MLQYFASCRLNRIDSISFFSLHDETINNGVPVGPETIGWRLNKRAMNDCMAGKVKRTISKDISGREWQLKQFSVEIWEEKTIVERREEMRWKIRMVQGPCERNCRTESIDDEWEIGLLSKHTEGIRKRRRKRPYWTRM